MIRTKKPIKPIKPIPQIEDTKKAIINPFGGHLPYPPDNCEKSEFSFLNNDIPWLDISICHNCKIIKKCKDRKIFLIKLKKLKKERKIK